MRYKEIRNWAKDKGIITNGDIKTQYIKLQEECGELAQAILKEDKTEMSDAVGDIVIVLTSLSELAGFNIESAIEGAWLEIKNREGKMINNNFVKNTDHIIAGTE